MKKLIYFSVFLLQIIFLFSSCNENTVQSEDPSVIKLEVIYANDTTSASKFHGSEGDILKFPVTVSKSKNLVCVNLFVDNKLVNSDSLYPYLLSWKATRGFQKLIHAEAVYVLGNAVSSNQLTCDITKNSAPEVSMEVYYNSPYVPGSIIDIELNIRDNNVDQSFSKIEIYDNSRILFTSDSSSRFKWSNPSSGNHTIFAKVYDSQGAVGVSNTKEIYAAPGVGVDGIISDLIYSNDSNLLFALNKDKNELLYINPEKELITDKFLLPDVQPLACEYLSSINKLFIVSKFSGEIIVWDILSHTYNKIQFSDFADGIDIQIDENDKRIYVQATNGLYLLSLDTYSLINYFNISISSMALDDINNNLFVMNNSTLQKYSLSDTKIQRVGELGSTYFGNPRKVAVNPEKTMVMVPSGGGNGNGYTVFAFDASNLKNILGEWYIGVYPTEVKFTRDGKYLLGTNGDFYDEYLYVMDGKNFSQNTKIQFPHASYISLISSNSFNDKTAAFSAGGNYPYDKAIYFFKF